MNILRQTVNSLKETTVHDNEGEYLGKIIDIIRDRSESTMHYLILKCKILFGGGNRFFAIPAFPTFITVNGKGEVILRAHKQDLQLARGVQLKHCPTPDLRFNPSILELYEYKEANI